jgi:hypothetical protein
MVIATMSLLGANAMADNFTFSFADGVGTVTGEIFGLQNNKTSSATEVLITSYPASFGALKDPIATDWIVSFNSFTEASGAITDDNFFASLDSSTDPLTPELAFDSSINSGKLLGTLVNVVGAPTFDLAAVPEPSAWILLLTVMLAAAIVKRSRRTDGLKYAATRMRS